MVWYWGTDSHVDLKYVTTVSPTFLLKKLYKYILFTFHTKQTQAEKHVNNSWFIPFPRSSLHYDPRGKKSLFLILFLLLNPSILSFPKYKIMMLKASLWEQEGLPRKGSHFHLATEGSHRRCGYSLVIFKLFLSPSMLMLRKQSNPLPAVNFRCSPSSIWFHCCQLHLVLSIRSLRNQAKEYISDFRTSVPTSAAKRDVTA